MKISSKLAKAKNNFAISAFQRNPQLRLETVQRRLVAKFGQRMNHERICGCQVAGRLLAERS